MSRRGGLYSAGKWDCGHTFDPSTFDLDIEKLARITERACGARGRVDPPDLPQRAAVMARRVAERAIKGSDHWISPQDWIKTGDYEEVVEGTLEEAYKQWRAGYTDCAIPELAHWILRRMGL